MLLLLFEFEDSLNKGKAPFRKEFIFIYIGLYIMENIKMKLKKVNHN